MTFFSGKISIFRVQISDDVFFSHRPGFSDFPFLFPDFPYVYYVKCRVPFPHKKNTFFTLFILSRVSENTTSQNIGGTNAWAVPPPQISWGTSPSVPPRSPPLP